MTEFTHRAEGDAKRARRAMIDAGLEVSLVALDPARDVFAFDADVPATCDHGAPADAATPLFIWYADLCAATPRAIARGEAPTPRTVVRAVIA